VNSELWTRKTRLQAALYASALFILNTVVARRLFVTEFTRHMNSNEGTFMAISRFLVESWPRTGWFPYWANGLPFQDTYSPALPVVDAVFSKVAHTSTALAFHAVVAFFYCLGPAMLFLFAWQVSRRMHASFWCGALYSLFSPSVIFPEVRADIGGWLNPRRLQTIGLYGEGAHNVVLSLLPLALLVAYLAMTRRRYGWWVATGALTGVMVLTNAFAAVDLFAGLAILALVQPRGERLRGLLAIGAVGVLAYTWISPFMPPSLIETIRSDSLILGGQHYAGRVVMAICIVAAGLVFLWALTSRLSDPLERFSILFAFVFAAMPACAYFAKIALLPEPERYHLEMEMGLCLAAVFGFRHAFVRLNRAARLVGVLVFLAFMAHQAIGYFRFAGILIQPADIATTLEFKTARWITTQLPGLRTMVSGDVGFWFNVFTDNPQLSASHVPFSPNLMVQIAVYTIYTGQNAGARDADIAVTWLKAYGCHAVTVPGPNSREYYKPFSNPRKFEGVLPVLWREDDDTIYAVPERSSSLAHVIPTSAVIRRPPIHGLDVDEVSRFVAALDDPALPDAPLAWADPEHGHIAATVHPGQAVTVQVTYDRGWGAKANGRPTSISRDGIGLMVLQPACDGQCDIDLVFDVTSERNVCRLVSLLTMLAVFAGAGWSWVRRRRATELSRASS
jgi:hypothetical protein